MSDPRRSWDEAIATYEEQMADGDRSAVFLLDVVRRLAVTAVGSRLKTLAWEECLGICVPDDCRPPPGTPRIYVVSEADDIDYFQDEFGESPDDLDPTCWRVELRGIVRTLAGGDEEQTLEMRRCFGGAAEVVETIVAFLPRLRPIPRPPPTVD